MIQKKSFNRDQLEWSHSVIFRVRFIGGLVLFIGCVGIKKLFEVPFPLAPILIVCLFESCINQPYPFIQKKIASLNNLLYINTSIDVIAITIFIHYTGGIEVPFFTLAYMVAIVFVGIVHSLSIAIWLATMSSVAYGGIIGLEYFRLVEHIGTTGILMTGYQQFLFCFNTVFFFYMISYFTSLPSSQLKKKDSELREKVDELGEALDLLRKRAKQLTRVADIFRDIALSLDINTVLGKIVEQISTVLRAEKISVMLLNEKNTLTIKSSLGIPPEIVESTCVQMGEGISGWVAHHQEPLLVENIDEDPRFSPRCREDYYTKSLISCPLIVKNRTIGVININNKKNRGSFNTFDFEIAKALCANMSVAIESARLYTGLRQSYINTVESLALAVDARDHYTQGHLKRVCDFALSIGQEMGLSEDRLENLRIAALMHDIGKIGISDTILLKSGKLTDEEWEKMREHPVVSEKIIQPLRLSKDVLDMVRHHHERYDGRGYPDGIAREALILEAYILGVADSFDAMMSDRPYRKSLGRKKAIEELIKCKGSQFHSQVVEAFIKTTESHELKMKEEGNGLKVSSLFN